MPTENTIGNPQIQLPTGLRGDLKTTTTMASPSQQRVLSVRFLYTNRVGQLGHFLPKVPVSTQWADAVSTLELFKICSLKDSMDMAPGWNMS